MPPMGPKPRSTMLTEAEEAIIVEFRRRTLLPLDDARRSSRNDVMECLKDQIPKLTRSALHRCLVRHGISRLPQDEKASSKRQSFKETKIGYVHIDSAQLRSAEGKTHMVLAIDRVSKFAHVEFHPTAEMATGAPSCAASSQRSPTRATPCSPTTAPRPPRTPRPSGTPCPACRLHDAPGVRPRVRRARHRAQAHLALPPLDQRPSRAHEPHRQGRHGQGVPLRNHPSPARPRPGVRRRLQLCQAPQGASMASTVPGHLRRLENRPSVVQDQPAPSHPGTIHDPRP